MPYMPRLVCGDSGLGHFFLLCFGCQPYLWAICGPKPAHAVYKLRQTDVKKSKEASINIVYLLLAAHMQHRILSLLRMPFRQPGR